MSEPIVIIGAGMGGLAAALALLQRGISVEIFEDAPELGEVGAGLSIQDSTRRAIGALGLIEALAPEVVTVTGVGRRHFQTGEIVTFQPYEGPNWLVEGPFSYFLHRADLHAALVTAVQTLHPTGIHLGHTLVDVQQDGQSVEARFANGTTAKGSALIGSDGLRSSTRRALLGPDNPRFSGLVSWRGLVPVERLRPELTTPQSWRWVAPNWRFLTYPVHHGALLNYVASVADQTWQIESWKEPSTVADAMAAFAEGDPTISEIIRETPPETCFKWALFDRDPLATWTVGRVTLLGDAAHPMLPFLGAGAGLALENALVLARCIEHDNDITTAFARYEAHRKPRTNAAQVAAREIGRWPFDVRFRNDGTATPETDRAGMPEPYDASTAPLTIS